MSRRRKVKRRFSSASVSDIWSASAPHLNQPSVSPTLTATEGFEQKPRPHIYASLPPSPISPSPPSRPLTPLTPVSPISLFEPALAQPFSLWDYLREELLATDFDSHQELKWDRVSNFLNIPVAIEKIIGFGFILCLDSFLYTFTILPIRFALAWTRFLANTCSRKAPPLPPSQKADILRTLLLVVSIMILNPLTDASQIYHFIRGQDTIKFPL